MSDKFDELIKIEADEFLKQENERIQKEMEQVEEEYYVIAEKNWEKIKKTIYEEIEKKNRGNDN